MMAERSDLGCVLRRFKDNDDSGHGVMQRSDLRHTLDAIGCRNVDKMLDAAGFVAEDPLSYEQFLEWLEQGSADPKTPTRVSRNVSLPSLSTPIKQSKHDKKPSHDREMPTSQSKRCDRLVNTPQTKEMPSMSTPRKTSKGSQHRLTRQSTQGKLEPMLSRSVSCASEMLQPEHLKLPSVAIPLHREKIPPPQTHSEKSEPASSKPQRLESIFNSCKATPEVPIASHLSNKLDFREQAALVVQETGRPGELVHDLKEISIADLENRPAMACWRSCYGLRVYRSETVTKALRLICSAPVPGLGGASYLDVFKTLTASGWEHNIFLFGGLVRDILRRKVGNDIDITFSAPAAELAEICKANSYKCTLEGDYILIGDAKGEEYLEGMVVTHNGVTPPENSDFSMNWVFYDFVNDVIIDKTGFAVLAIVANRLEIPCSRAKWDSWIAIGGSAILFRYYKFLIRGFEYDPSEMAFIAGKLLDFWGADAEKTVRTGREILRSLVSAQDSDQISRLRQVVSISFDMAAGSGLTKRSNVKRRNSFAECNNSGSTCATGAAAFLTANHWWQMGWLHVLSP